jgi:hypothetical protein
VGHDLLELIDLGENLVDMRGIDVADMIANTSMSFCVSIRTRLALSPSLSSSNVRFSMRCISWLRFRRRSRHNMVARVDAFDITRERRGGITDEESGEVAYVFDAYVGFGGAGSLAMRQGSAGR